MWPWKRSRRAQKTLTALMTFAALFCAEETAHQQGYALIAETSAAVSTLPQPFVPFDEAPAEISAPGHLTIGLKYVAYVDASGKPVITVSELHNALRSINELYSSCNVHFRLESYTAVVPQDLGLNYSPTSMRELDVIRRAFDNPNQLVVVGTGRWNHKGGLGADGANAWTAMPGSTPSGTIIEGNLAGSPELVGHELGHALNLDHHKDAKNVMNPIIYNGSRFNASQCRMMRESAYAARSSTLRDSLDSIGTGQIDRKLASSEAASAEGSRRSAGQSSK